MKDRLVLQKGHCLFSAAALTSASPSSSQSLIFAFSDRSDPNSLQGPKSYISYLQNPSRLITTNFCISPIPWLLLTSLHALPPVQCYLYINVNNLIIADFKNLPPSSLLKHAFLSISFVNIYPGRFQPILIPTVKYLSGFSKELNKATCVIPSSLWNILSFTGLFMSFSPFYNHEMIFIILLYHGTLQNAFRTKYGWAVWFTSFHFYAEK